MFRFMFPLFQTDGGGGLVPGEEPPQPAGRKPARITCDFCGCSLAVSGDVLSMSDQAKKMRRASDDLAVAREELAKVTADLAAAQTELADVKRTVEVNIGPKETRRMFSDW
jgi:hypothetical protein